MTNRYLLRPFRVDAAQWTDNNAAELAALAGDRFMTIDPQDRSEDPEATAALRESNHDTWDLLTPGDWVIRRPDGRFFRLEDEQFREAYTRDTVPTPDRAALRDRIAEALALRENPPASDGRAWFRDEQHRESFLEDADAVLALLPPPADRAAVYREAADDLATAFGDPMAKHIGAISASHLRRRAREIEAGQTSETPADTEAQPESCANCGKTIRRITGTLTAWWVHVPGGQAMCQPWQPARSTRATPKPAAGARQDGAQTQEPGTEPEDPLCICMHPRSRHLKISGRLLCDECVPDSTENLVCKEFEAL